MSNNLLKFLNINKNLSFKTAALFLRASLSLIALLGPSLYLTEYIFTLLSSFILLLCNSCALLCADVTQVTSESVCLICR